MPCASKSICSGTITEMRSGHVFHSFVQRTEKKPVATLLAVTYPDPQTAKQAMERIDWANFDKQVNVLEACQIRNEQGELKVDHLSNPVARKAAVAGTVGLVIGALFALPVAGLAAGAALGARAGKQVESQLDQDFVSTIKAEVTKGGSAIVVLYEEGADTQRAGADLAALGGTVHSTTVTPDELERMQQVIDRVSSSE